MNRNKKLANMAMLVALAMIFSYVESLEWLIWSL